jgi:hypothetical protein
MHVLSETWVMSHSIQAGKSGLEPKPTSLLQPVTWVTGKEIGLREWRRFWRERLQKGTAKAAGESAKAGV